MTNNAKANWTTVATRATTAVVAGVAGFSSYRHIVEVARAAGEHGSVALVLPLSIDGLIVVGTMAMVDDKRSGRQPRLSARVALGVGVVATLAANIASAQPNLTARLVAAIPAVAFLITVEVLARSGRKLTPPAMAVEAEPDVSEEPFPDPWQYATPIGPEPVMEEPVDVKPAAKRSTPKVLTNAQKVARIAGRNPSWSLAQIAAKADVSESTARRYVPADHPGLKSTSLPSASGSSPAETPAKTINGNQPDLQEAHR
jgi:hypothetical protein